jgi:DNA-binding phage protein
MRRAIEPGPRRQDAAVLAEIQASFDNDRPGSMTQAAAARLLSRAAGGNPTLETLQEILRPLGLRVSIALDEAA